MSGPRLDWRGTGRYDWRANWCGEKRQIVVVIKTKDGTKIVPAYLLRGMGNGLEEGKKF